MGVKNWAICFMIREISLPHPDPHIYLRLKNRLQQNLGVCFLVVISSLGNDGLPLYKFITLSATIKDKFGSFTCEPFLTQKGNLGII